MKKAQANSRSASSTVTNDHQMPPIVCDDRCTAERRVHVRDMSKWGRQMLMLTGLENVFQRALGPAAWRKFSRAVKASTKHSSTDFEIDLHSNCNWCLGSRAKMSLGPESFLAMNDDALMKSSAAPPDFTSTQQLLPPLMALPTRSSPPSASSASSSSASSSSSSSIHPPSTSPTKPSSATHPLDWPLPNPQTLLGHPLSAVGATNSAEQRFAMAAAALQMFSAAINRNCPAGDVDAAPPPTPLHPAAAFLSSTLLPNATGFCAWPPFLPPHPLAPFCPLPPFLPLSSSSGHINNGSSSSPSTPSTPPAPPPLLPNMLDFQQQLAIAWQSQLLGLSLMGSLNGLGTSLTNGAAFDPLPSEDEALAFLASFGSGSARSTHTHSPTMRSDEQQQPLDLTKSNGTSKKKKKHRKMGSMNKSESGDEPLEKELQPQIVVEQDEDEAGAVGELLDGADGGEDGSEAESPKIGTKRTYSQADLDAAVTDIRMGRLGTRRASVVYGIPRSTLRNKIYKLEAAEDNGDGTCKRRRLTAFAAHKMEQRIAAQRMPPTTEDADGTDSPNSMNFSGNSDQQNMATDELCSGEAKPGSPLIGGNSEPIVANGGGTPPPLLRQNSLPTFPLLGTNSAEQLLKEFTSLVHQQQNKQKRENNKSNGEEAVKVEENGGEEESNGQKRQQKSKAEATKRKQHQQQEKGTATGGSRPKRGQYRKYDKEALDKAVASVRSGEMSVHRAGSVFGVPHSTLEYKVKERNLLRTKSKKALHMPNSGTEFPSPSSERQIPLMRSDDKSNGGVEVEESEITEVLDSLLKMVENGEAN